MFNLAQEEIFDRYKHPLFAGRIANPSFTVEGSNPLCGDEIVIEGVITHETFQELKHTTRACAICTASTDFLLEELQGNSTSRLKTISSEHLIERLGIPLSATRSKCALLPLETLKQAQI